MPDVGDHTERLLVWVTDELADLARACLGEHRLGVVIGLEA